MMKLHIRVYFAKIFAKNMGYEGDYAINARYHYVSACY